MKQSTILAKISYHKSKVDYFESLILNTRNEDIKQIIRKPTPTETKKIRDICKKHRVLEEEFFSWRRNKFIVKARADVCNFFRSKGYTLSRIWMLLWNHNHASVHYLLKKYPNTYDSTIQQ